MTTQPEPGYFHRAAAPVPVPMTAASPATDPEPPRVKFGPRDDDTMPHSWAERGLTWLKENRQPVFADMMLAVLEVNRTRARAPRDTP